MSRYIFLYFLYCISLLILVQGILRPSLENMVEKAQSEFVEQVEDQEEPGNSPRAPYVNKLITNPQSFNELSKTIEIQVKEKQDKMKREEMSKNSFVNAQIDSIRMRTVEKLGTFPSVKRGYTVPKLSSSPSYGVADGNNIGADYLPSSLQNILQTRHTEGASLRNNVRDEHQKSIEKLPSSLKRFLLSAKPHPAISLSSPYPGQSSSAHQSPSLPSISSSVSNQRPLPPLPPLPAKKMEKDRSS